MRPQRYLSVDVNEFEMAALGMPSFAVVSIDNVNLEECLVVSQVIVTSDSGEFLVGWHKR